jgi:hypothetical protein
MPGQQRYATTCPLFVSRGSRRSQLGDDQPAVRLAGLHAMAGLADDWKQNRQTCVDVLCAYLRLPYDPDRATTPTRLNGPLTGRTGRCGTPSSGS